MIVQRLFAFALLLLAVPGSASAAERAIGAVAADGERFAAWRSAPTRLVVFDDRTQKRTALTIPDCPVSAVGAGKALLSCPGRQPGPQPVTIDLATGDAEELPLVPVEDGAFGGYPLWLAIGRYGLFGALQGYHWSGHGVFDPAARRWDRLRDPDRAIDLDVPALARPLCAPVRRTPQTSTGLETHAEYGPIWFERPWAVEQFVVERGTETRRILRVWRCGERRPRTLGPSWGAMPSIGAGRVVWHDGDHVHAFSLASGRRWSRRIDFSRDIARAGRTVIVFATHADSQPRPLRFRRLPTP